MVSQHGTGVGSLMGEIIFQPFINSDSNESDNNKAAYLSVLLRRDIMDATVEQLNLFQRQVLAMFTSGDRSHVHQWKDVTACEHYVFLTLITPMAHASKGTIAELRA